MTWGVVVLARLEFRRYSIYYQFRSALINDASTWTNSSWRTIRNAPHHFKLDCTASSTSGANDGRLALCIECVQKAALTGVDNNTRAPDFVRLRTVGGIDTGTLGIRYFVATASTRSS